MATWPATLPNPSREGLSIEFGKNSMDRVCQSGRTESVRYGSGAPDRWKIKIRLMGPQFSIFRNFFNQDLNIGTNWFSASWITTNLGYADHKGKIVGYPAEIASGEDGSGASYKDITFDLIIKPTSACPADDTVWG